VGTAHHHRRKLFPQITSSVTGTDPAQAAFKWKFQWWAMPTLPDGLTLLDPVRRRGDVERTFYDAVNLAP
jgi:hypothetical protein